MRRLPAVPFVVAALVSAALAAPVQAQQVDLKPGAKPKRDKYVITAQEIAERPELTNAYDAVKLLRPEFLKTTRAGGGLAGSRADGSYRPDVVGRPPGGRGGSSTTTTTGSTGSEEPRAGAGAPTSDDRGEGGLYAESSGGKAATTAVLYIDEVKQPSIEELRNIRPGEVVEIRYLTGNQAAGRYGAGHEGGAIMLKTNRMTGKP